MAFTSIIIPTHNRPELLDRAIRSALAQEESRGVEVVVVDDGSAPPARVPEDARIRLIRLETNRGGAAARNVGLAAASGQWVTYLDDDDELLPGMIRASLDAIAASDLARPVAAVCALEAIHESEERVSFRLPPTLAIGRVWSLERIPSDRSFFVKQSLVVERKVLIDIGGFDESFLSRVHSELFLRLNPVCSIQGTDFVGYRLFRHGGPSVSLDRSLIRSSFYKLIRKHEDLLLSHPGPFAIMMRNHARRCRAAGLRFEALWWFLRATRYGAGLRRARATDSSLR